MDAEQGARLRVALVGAGLVGQAAHAVTLAEDRTRFDFVAVVDPSPTAPPPRCRSAGTTRAATS